MSGIVECVPNFSEGKDPGVIKLIADAITSVKGISLLGIDADSDHNRTVVTFVGDPQAVLEASFRAVEKAAELIDIRKHSGVHPRIGATDVVPFVPLVGVTMDDCVELSRRLGRMVGEELGIPVFLYAESARLPGKRRLADIRRGGYEKLVKEIGKTPIKTPDYGPCKVHPTAGAVAVGARKILVAFNVYLDTKDVRVAREIAKSIRESDGGLPSVQALGLYLPEKGAVQVSMNLLDFERTSIHAVMERVKEEASRLGVEVLSSEIVGLVPLRAVVETVAFYLRAPGLKTHKILEEMMFYTA